MLQIQCKMNLCQKMATSPHGLAHSVFLGLVLHYSLLAFLYKFDAYASAFWSSGGGTASPRTRSPSLPLPSLCYALEDHGRHRISRNTIALTLDIGLAPHANQRPGLFIRPIARHHWYVVLLQTLITHIHCMYAYMHVTAQKHDAKWISSRWSYLTRTIPDIQYLLLPLEKEIHQTFIPAITGRPPCSELERDLLSLPARLGGMGLTNQATVSQNAFLASQRLTAPLAALIITQETNQAVDSSLTQRLKSTIRSENRQRHDQLALNIYDQLIPQQKRCVDLAKARGSSSWLFVLAHGPPTH